jgi:hypothetical protein
MEHESFSNPAIAELMNENFVCVKVDREERPDVDAVYMAATQAMSGSGGWPMTVFLSPDGSPFFAGTYFPPRDAYGRPGFPTLLQPLVDGKPALYVCRVFACQEPVLDPMKVNAVLPQHP